MSKLIMRDQTVWMGGFDISGAQNALAVDLGAEVRDATALGDQTRRNLAGLKTMAAGMQGWFDAGAGIDQLLFDQIGLADAPISYAPAGSANEGDLAFSFLALHVQYSPQGAVGEVFNFTAAAQAARGDGLQRGTIMHNGTEAASGDGGSGQQLGAIAQGQQLYGALHVLAAGGVGPTLDLIVESDDANTFASATTRMTFAQQTAVGFDCPTPVTGPVTDDWWRMAWTLGGTTPSFQFVCILAIQ